MGEQRKISINLLTKAFWCGIIITSKGFAYYEEEYLLKVKPLLSKINTDTFIEDYLTACKVEDVGEYLNPTGLYVDEPSLYVNMDKACSMVKHHIGEGNKISILCDEDCDGECSTAIIYTFLKSLGANIKVFFHNISKAHGLTKTSKDTVIDDIIAWEPSLLIIPDASTDEYCCKELKQHGCDVIFLDHHNYDFSSNPYAVIVNCLQQPNTNQSASGSLVTAKFCQRYAELYGIKCPDYTDLVAMSLVSDVMDLSSMENRQYISDWLRGWNGIE